MWPEKGDICDLVKDFTIIEADIDEDGSISNCEAVHSQEGETQAKVFQHCVSDDDSSPNRNPSLHSSILNCEVVHSQEGETQAKVFEHRVSDDESSPSLLTEILPFNLILIPSLIQI
ncbi:hypothetical protein THAOC_23678, partial [Thalassiosira oceanica]